MEQRKVEFFRHEISDTDIESVVQVLKTPFLTTGPRVKLFEEKLAALLGVKEGVGLTSCTGALHLALLRYGIGPGDEVITTPMSFVATASAVIEAGAVPVFVDVCPKTGFITPDTAQKAITKKTKAILPVHLYGRMVDMKGFHALAKAHNLILIEDAAHALEAERDGIRPGQLSHAACFSFYATKGMTCGEGGALACQTEEDGVWYRSARHHGISKNAASRYTKRYEHWDMEMMGWKYNMDDIQAALLINQIDRVHGYRARREELTTLYRKHLSGICGLELLESAGTNEKNACHLMTPLLPRGCNRDDVLNKLQEAGIGCAVNYRAVHTMTYFKNSFNFEPEDFPVAYDIGCRTITLPLYPSLADESVEFVCKTLGQILSET
jgi:dTDP-4-amino-4,6-dideoxygalactose transaminase